MAEESTPCWLLTAARFVKLPAGEAGSHPRAFRGKVVLCPIIACRYSLFFLEQPAVDVLRRA